VSAYNFGARREFAYRRINWPTSNESLILSMIKLYIKLRHDDKNEL
jgi:hypothetical protein